MGKILQGRDDLTQAWSWRGPQGRTWGALAPQLLHNLSPHSVCKKSPNFLPALSLKQCRRWVWPCAGKGRFPGAIRPKKEYIKPCETYFANTLNINDKDGSMEWVCSPKFYGPLAIWTWLKPSEFFEWYLLFDHYWLTMIDEFYIYALYSLAN